MVKGIGREVAVISLLEGRLIVTMDGVGGGSIDDTALKEVCPECGQISCEGCRSSKEGLLPAEGELEEYILRCEFNAAIDGISSLVLAHALAGIEVESERYRIGLETALDAVGNQF